MQDCAGCIGTAPRQVTQTAPTAAQQGQPCRVGLVTTNRSR